MKKLVGILAISALAVSVYAQGTVVFINNTAGLIKQWTATDNPAVISAPVGGAHVELLSAPSSTSLTAVLGSLGPSGFITSFSTLASFLAANPGWSDIGITGISPAAGRFNGGTFALPGVAVGANANYLVIGWTGTAATYDAAYTAYLAHTAMIGTGIMTTTGTGNPTTTPPGTATPLSGTFTGLTMGPAPVPEPTSLALAGLGLAALLAFRRRS